MHTIWGAASPCVDKCRLASGGVGGRAAAPGKVPTVRIGSPAELHTPRPFTNPPTHPPTRAAANERAGDDQPRAARAPRGAHRGRSGRLQVHRVWAGGWAGSAPPPPPAHRPHTLPCLKRPGCSASQRLPHRICHRAHQRRRRRRRQEAQGTSPGQGCGSLSFPPPPPRPCPAVLLRLPHRRHHRAQRVAAGAGRLGKQNKGGWVVDAQE